MNDARLFQIAFLGCLLGLGAALRDFAIRPEQVVLTFASALATQALGDRLSGRAFSGLRSAVVTSLGLSLLLRANALWVHPLAAVIAIGAKFVLRVRGKHLFNPANLGVIVSLLALPGTWVSAGQWGNDVALAAWFLVLGTTVVCRASRSDVSFAFLASWLGLVGLRVFWLGQSFAVWRHQLESGALLLFTFFMISDPRTIPNRRGARIAHAFVVAAIAYVWQYQLFRTNGLLWALFLATPLVPLLDRLFPAPKYEWLPTSEPTPSPGGQADDPLSSRRPRSRALSPRPA